VENSIIFPYRIQAGSPFHYKSIEHKGVDRIQSNLDLAATQ
jgi:hypothetical protein